jgi:hypothetical protein
MEKENKKSKVCKAVTVIIVLVITVCVMAAASLGFVILREVELLSKKYEEVSGEIEERIKELQESVEELDEEFDNIKLGIRNAGREVERLNKVYGNILSEQKKKRVESVYTDKELADKMAEARVLLEEGKINRAYSIYDLVAGEQPENREARFYKYYTLFLKNKSDREEYAKIKNGFNTLEKEGYERKEMKEVFFFIEEEEGVRSIEPEGKTGE